MELIKDKVYHGFRLNQISYVKEASSDAYLFEHIKSGARLLYLKNNDDNKVFCVSFLTTPESDCGTPHIMEHSVLCGSEKYPLKEPFVELVKSSLSTFLNAITYPDKTMYPVASKNEADLVNLIDVYCDAVFNPRSMTSPLMFYQEGWHYHITDKSEPLSINGVVYNEMKGVYSDPEEIIGRYSQLVLFPDTPYRFESGGDPKAIPQLTYEEYVSFYKKYYHPSNSYIYFYGDMDVMPYLQRLDEEYLSGYEKSSDIPIIPFQKTLSTPSRLELTYPAPEDLDDKGAYFTLNYKIGEATDTRLSYAFDVLSKILMDADASPLKKALKEAGIADEFDFDYVTCTNEPYFCIMAKNAPKDKLSIFEQTVENTLTMLCDKGIEANLIKSALNSTEFDLREADSGNYPIGLLYLLDITESWLYGGDPLTHLRYEEQLKFLRENETSDYYVSLIKKYLLENTHKGVVALIPERGGSERSSSEFTEKLKHIKESMSKEELERAIDITKELLTLQDTPDTEEAKSTIPTLEISQINRNPENPVLISEGYNGAYIHAHPDKCSGITYLDLNFDLNLDCAEQLSAASLLCVILGVYKTKLSTEEELSHKIGIYLGDFDVSINTYQNISDLSAYERRLCVCARALNRSAEAMLEIINEILTQTLITDPTVLKRTLAEEILKFENKLISSGHSFALKRIESFTSKRGAYADYIEGIGYYTYLKKAQKALYSGDESVLNELQNVLKQVINTNNCDVLITCDDDNIPVMTKHIKGFLGNLPCFNPGNGILSFELTPLRREAIKTTADVCYTALGCNYLSLGIAYNPIYRLMHKYLSSVYLWENVRVMGGAYGAMMRVDAGGGMVFVSYRDPQLKRTLDAYRAIPAHIEKLDLSLGEMNKLIIGAFGDIDAPVQSYTKGRNALYNDKYRGDSYEARMSRREKILSAGKEDLKALSEPFEKMIASSAVCSAAPSGAINSCKEEFDEVIDIRRLLF